ncbi:MAG: hypothetical protein WDO69_25100 [Pseudomonadota bacterium]
MSTRKLDRPQVVNLLEYREKREGADAASAALASLRALFGARDTPELLARVRELHAEANKLPETVAALAAAKQTMREQLVETAAVDVAQVVESLRLTSAQHERMRPALLEARLEAGRRAIDTGAPDYDADALAKWRELHGVPHS